MKIHKIACIGAGLIGQGWATAFSAKGFDVLLQDANKNILDQAFQNVGHNLRLMEENGFLEEGDSRHALERVRITSSIDEALNNADYVQESVPDNYDIKRQLFKEMDAITPEYAILSSSASGLLMSEIQKVTTKPERCVLAHPMLPVHIAPVVEVVGGKQTSRETIDITRDLLKKAGKIPVVLNKEVPGYIVNRLGAALLREAIDLVDSGVASAEDVDTAFSMGVGIKYAIMGPLLRIHTAGNGVEDFFEKYSESYHYRWETMKTWTSVSDAAKASVVKSVNEMEIIRTKKIEEINNWRDKLLFNILKLIREDDIK